MLIKPGVLRMAILRAVHRGLGLLLRMVASDGYLGRMRTIHFAHWAMVSNGSRLMFFSNFDQTWESYLDDFIEKAHGGLTLSWSSGVGFPATRFLVLDGASYGRQFKDWARHSMAVSRFWYSAYTDHTSSRSSGTTASRSVCAKPQFPPRRPRYGSRTCDRCPAEPAEWRSSSPLRTIRDPQGIVVSGFNRLPSALALFLFCDWPENGPGAAVIEGKGAWVQALRAAAPITDADDADPRAATLAFTWSGLQKLGLSADALATFSQPFREGMYQEDRLRRLGDKVNDTWQGTVIDGGPRWSGNIPARKEKRAETWERAAGDAGVPEERDEREVVTPITVHAMLVLYDVDEVAVKNWATTVAGALAPHGVKIVHRLPLDLRLDQDEVGREHFGFADGLSQPLPDDEMR